MKEKVASIIEILKSRYPDALCALHYGKDYELMIAVRLSAQCTDARVNLVTPALFAAYPTLEAMAAADIEDVESIVRPCGFYHTKAKDIIAMAKMIIERFDSKVPDNIEDLTSLPGVGRKTANLICGDIYGKPAVVADTHLIRITNLLGFVDTKDPYKVEMRLKEILPPEESNDFCHRCVLHGRAVCIARRPQCNNCCLGEICSFKKTNS